MRKNIIKAMSLTFAILCMMFAAVTFSACGQQKYEVTLNIASGCDIDVSNLEIELFDFDGTSQCKTTFSNGKAIFDVQDGNYVATLSPIDEKYDYQVVFLTKSKKSSTITLKQAAQDGNDYLHSFSVYIKNFNAQNDYRIQACEINADNTPGVCHFKKAEVERVDFDVKFKDYSVELLIANVEFNSIENFSFNDANRYVIL